MLFPTLDALRLIAYHAAICIFVSLCSGHLHSLDQVHIFEDQSNHVRSGIFFLLVYIKFDKKNFRPINTSTAFFSFSACSVSELFAAQKGETIQYFAS